MKTATKRAKTDYYWKCYAEAEMARRMATVTGDRRYVTTARRWETEAKKAARVNGRA